MQRRQREMISVSSTEAEMASNERAAFPALEASTRLPSQAQTEPALDLRARRSIHLL